MPASSFRVALLALFTVVGIAAGAGLPGASAQPETGDCELEPLTLPLFDATSAAQIAAMPLALALDADTSDEAILAAVEDLLE